MREIIRVERKRLLNRKLLIIISIIILCFSIFSTIKSLKDYTVYDSKGKIIISSRENLKESKKHKILLNEQALNDIVKRKDKGRYLYNLNLVRLVASNYPDKKVEEITNKEIKNFYNQRINILKSKLENGKLKYSDKELDYLISKGKELKQPLNVGYVEGWKNLNNGLIDFIPIILVLISIIVLPVFSEDSKTKMRELYISTKYGKKLLIKARIIAGIEVGAILYSVAVVIFSIIKLVIFGIEGYNLPIQSNINYFFSIININFLQQYIMNIAIGFLAMLLLIAITYCFTVLVKQILSGAVLVVFFWIIMFIMPNNMNIQLTHYFANFLPYNMTNFNFYYMSNELYSILGKIIMNSIWVVIIDLVVFVLLIIITIFISNIKLSRSIK